MQDRVKGEVLLPRLAPIARRVPPAAIPKGPARRLADRVSHLAEVTGQRRRGLVIFPVMELLGLATLIFLLAK